MKRTTLLLLALTLFGAAPALAQLEPLLGGTVMYNGEVLSSPKQHLAFGSFLPGATISVPLTNLTQRAQIGVAYNARSTATVSMANGGRLTQVDPGADGNAGTAGAFVPVYACNWIAGDSSGPFAGGATGVQVENCFGSGGAVEMDLQLNADGLRTHRWILVGGSIAGSQTATQPAGRYEGTITVTIRRHGT